MRKQYYFQPSKNGYYAWDIDHLIDLSNNITAKDIPIDAIKELDENFWFASKEQSPTCRAIVGHAALIQAAELEYPIILSASGKVMDGMHRVAKALLEGKGTVKAVQFMEDPAPDYEDIHPDELPY